MDITETLDALAGVVASAKPRALGGGAIIDREHAMALVEQVRNGMPEEFRLAQGVLAERDLVMQNANAEADQVRANAQTEAQRLVSQDEVTLAANDEAMRIIDAANADAERKRAEIDAYVDGKLAAFEGSLLKTLESVQHGRAKLAGEWVPPEAAEQGQ